MESEKMCFPFYRVDAFSDKIFSGNPAGVCICNKTIDMSIKQAIATETNLSETAFISIPSWEALKSEQAIKLQWFTPRVEVQLCGHATLATAYVLFNELGIERETIVFNTLSGELSATRQENYISLRFPANHINPRKPPSALLTALGIKEYDYCGYSDTLKGLLIHVPNERLVTTLRPDFALLEKSVPAGEITGVIVTAASETGYDFCSRFFAPWLGINEDPVTGAAHTVLGPYWSKLLNKTSLKAFQASKRGGVVRIKLISEQELDLSGEAIVFMRGNIFIDDNQGICD